MNADEKICPDCGEIVKARARKCRFCGYEFAPLPVETTDDGRRMTEAPTYPSSATRHPSIEEGEVLNLLSSLVDKNLVLYDEGAQGQGRYRLLETVRKYSAERLKEEGASSRFRRQHADHFLALVEEGRKELAGTEQVVWLERLETEHDNLRATLDYYEQEPDRGVEALQLAAALQPFWRIRGYVTEGRHYLSAILELSKAQEPGKPRAEALYGAGVLASLQGDYEQARAYQQESLTLARELGDKKGISASLNSLGNIAKDQGDYETARSCYQESLTLKRELADQQGIATSLNNLGLVAGKQGDYETALSYFQESLSIWRELDARQAIAHCLNNLGLVAQEQGDNETALFYYQQSLPIFRALADKYSMAISLNNLGNVSKEQGDYEAARSYHNQSLSLRRDLADRAGIAASLYNLGLVAQEQGDKETARTYFRESLRIESEVGNKHNLAEALEALASLGSGQGHLQRAVCLVAASQALRNALGAPLKPGEREKWETHLADLLAGLGEEAFHAAWTEGCALTLEQVIAYALQESDTDGKAE